MFPVRLFASCAFLLGLISPAFTAQDPITPAETDVLFVGNSFTYGHKPLLDHGGIPAIFESIARAKGKTVATKMTAPGGKDWAFHLGRPAFPTLILETLDWVVLQDYSTRPTHVGNVGAFMADGQRLADLIASKAPNAGLILFETWAREKNHEFYLGDPPKFVSPAAMFDEVRQSYAELRASLAQGNPGRAVRIAPIGTAFARCVENHPEIPLYYADLYHADVIGSYLAALVLYATIFEESPVGAQTEFPTFSVPPETAAILQKIVEDVVFNPAG